MPSRLIPWLPEPPAFTVTENIWLRLLGLIYISSFASFWPQIAALIGSHGIVPAADWLTQVHNAIGSKAYWEVPSLFWFGLSDHALIGVCMLGCIGGLLLVIGFVPRWAALACYILYLSIVVIGQPFTNFQWDALLLESGFLAIFAGTTPLVVWGYRLLLFRLMFESGIVKLTSGDPNWRNLHALWFHFMTQPLPNPLAYWAYWLPHGALDALTAVTFVVELAVPFCLFRPRRVRQVAAALLVLLQLGILATGNYAFFNFLTIALCIWALDDRDMPAIAQRLASGRSPVRFRPVEIACTSVVAVLLALGVMQVIGMLAPASRTLFAAAEIVAPLEIVNTYGLFAVMTTTRPEISIEGSDDGTTWREYEFPYKPGPLNRSLPVIAPYQPRLDWQMWFAALGSYRENTWVGGLLFRLMMGDKTVEKLFEKVPFAHPPHYMRAQLWLYQFTTPKERAETGNIWKRTLQGTWFGPASLK